MMYDSGNERCKTLRYKISIKNQNMDLSKNVRSQIDSNFHFFYHIQNIKLDL